MKQRHQQVIACSKSSAKGEICSCYRFICVHIYAYIFICNLYIHLICNIYIYLNYISHIYIKQNIYAYIFIYVIFKKLNHPI